MRSGVMHRLRAAPPISDHNTGTTNSHRGTGETAAKRRPTVKRVVGQGTAKAGARGRWCPDRRTGIRERVEDEDAGQHMTRRPAPIESQAAASDAEPGEGQRLGQEEEAEEPSGGIDTGEEDGVIGNFRPRPVHSSQGAESPRALPMTQ
jgi:hypothetical protein